MGHQILNERLMITDEGAHMGGLAIKLINKTGAPSVRGEVLANDVANDFSVTLTGISDEVAVCTFLEDGVPDGDWAWVVIQGVAPFKADAGGFGKGDWLNTSATAGRAQGGAHPPSPVIHFQELGHAIQDAAANAVGLGIIHFN